MPSEVDPLLPQNEPAPEISGYGYPRRKQDSSEITYVDDPPSYDDPTDTRSTTSDDVTTKSALSTICGIFAIIVCFALVLSVFTHGSGKDNEPYQPRPIPRQPARTIEQRVSRILEDTPLIDGHNDLAIFLRFAYK